MAIDRTNIIKACNEARLKRIEKYNLNPKICKTCSKPLSYDERIKTFCNHSCSATFTNKDCVHHGLKHKRCKDCDKKIYPRNEKTERCRNCKTIYKILNGTYRGKNRNYLIKIRGHKCERCNNTHWEGELIPIDTHHIDGNKKNNDLKNLLLLCKNCHALTDNYGYKKARRTNKSPIV